MLLIDSCCQSWYVASDKVACDSCKIYRYYIH